MTFVFFKPGKDGREGALLYGLAFIQVIDHCYHGTAVQTTTKAASHWHIAAQPAAYRCIEQFPEFLFSLLDSDGTIGVFIVDVPITLY